MTRNQLNIEGKGNAKLPREREVMVYFNKDNYLVVKRKPANMRNISFLPYLEMVDSQGSTEDDWVMSMQELS